MYTSIVAMLIESAAPFTTLGIIIVVIGAQEKPLTWGFAYIWAMFCVESFYKYVEDEDG
jgi:hypothetical protein